MGQIRKTKQTAFGTCCLLSFIKIHLVIRFCLMRLRKLDIRLKDQRQALADTFDKQGRKFPGGNFLLFFAGDIRKKDDRPFISRKSGLDDRLYKRYDKFGQSESCGVRRSIGQGAALRTMR